ncbi:hypothetical protein SAMN02745172_04064 [Pseudoxanthobacter soli DSM 19599]|uniref:Uncharacterized protein n=1 Tax=Pseudoxanthobacter soli DSM 19599 TaxID=1123029 RepID=A0A1M7ZRV5_9HYPH|nr:hypothetical protein SAMN02745172_04064 [Pseudoxanthobacter soli DSM 19599]
MPVRRAHRKPKRAAGREQTRAAGRAKGGFRLIALEPVANRSDRTATYAARAQSIATPWRVAIRVMVA